MVGDLGEIAGGLGTLALSGARDTIGEGLELASDAAPGPGFYEHSSSLDDLVKAAPGVMAQDYKKRYGSGLDQAALSAYEDPLALLGDVATLLTFGGYGAAKAAQVGSRTSSTVADDLARLAAGSTDDVGRAARVANKILPGLKDRALVEQMGHKWQGPLAGTRNVLSPDGQRVVEVAREFNPVRRAARENVWDRALTRPVKALEAERDAKIESVLGEGATIDDVARRSERTTPTTVEMDALLLDRSVKLARANNIERATRPSVASGVFGRHGQIGRLVNRITGDSKTHHIAARDEAMREWQEVFSPLPDDELKTFHTKLQVDVPDAIAPRLDFDTVTRALDSAEVANTPMGQRLRDAVTPYVARIREMEQELSTMGPEAMVRGNSHELAIRRLAELDGDRATSRNGVGFNKEDSALGHQLAATPQSAWTAEQAEIAKGMTKRYRRQLEREGFQVGDLGDVLSPGERLIREVDAGKRVIEAVAGEPLAAWGRDFNDLGAKVMDDVRLLNFQRQGSRLLEDGGSFETLFRRQFLPLRVAEKRLHGLDSFEEATDPFILDDTLKAAGKKTPVYYPHYEELTKNPSAFLMSTNLRGARRNAQVSGFKKSQGVAFENHLKGIKDAYVKDPVEAYSRLAAEITKHDEMNHWIRNIAESVGRPVTALDEIGSGEVVMNLDGVNMAIRRRRTAMELMHENLEGGMEMDAAFADAVEQLFATPERDVAEALATRGSLIAIPKAAAKKIQVQSSLAFNNAGMRLLWDAPHNAWRAATLYAHPAYYINNAFGNTSFLKLQGGKLTGVVRQLGPRYRRALKEAIPDEALPDIETGFFSNPLQRSTHLGVAEGTTPGQVLKGVKQSRVGRATGKAQTMGQRLNTAIENAFRRESFITGVEQEAAKRGVRLAGNSFIRSHKRLNAISELGTNPNVAKKALDAMDDTMNNYMRLSSFERNIVRRFFIPFWPFYKHASRTLITMPYKHPAKARLLEWIDLTSQEMDEHGERPEWLDDMEVIGEGSIPGTLRFQSSRGANPVAGVSESPMGLLNPVLQMGLEQVTGRDTFTGRQFSAGDVYNDPITGQQFRIDPESGEAELLERRFGGLQAPVTPSLTESLISSVRPIDTIRDLLGGGARYTASGRVIRDENGEPLYPHDALQELLKLVGFSTIDYDLGNYQEKFGEAQQRATSALANRMQP